MPTSTHRRALDDTFTQPDSEIFDWLKSALNHSLDAHDSCLPCFPEELGPPRRGFLHLTSRFIRLPFMHPSTPLEDLDCEQVSHLFSHVGLGKYSVLCLHVPVSGRDLAHYGEEDLEAIGIVFRPHRYRAYHACAFSNTQAPSLAIGIFLLSPYVHN